MDFHVKNDLGFFPRLQELGVSNFFTYDNEKWGNMSLYTNRSDAISKFKQVFQELNISYDIFVNLSTEHVDVVRFLDENSLKIYDRFSFNYKSQDLRPVILQSDCVVTKLKIPIAIEPGDCPIIVVTGIDKKDNQRFAIFVHSGFFGTVLGITTKAITTAHAFYDFENEELDAFIFPFISPEKYIKTKNAEHLFDILNEESWKDYILDMGENFGIDIGAKVESELIKLKVGKVFKTDIDTFEANEAGKLFSESFLKSNKLIQTQRFAVGICLN